MYRRKAPEYVIDRSHRRPSHWPEVAFWAIVTAALTFFVVLALS